EFMRADSLVTTSPGSDRRRRHGGTSGQRFAGGYLEWLIRGKDDGRRAHSLVRRGDTRRRHTFVGESLHSQDHANPRHDDAVVSRYESLLRAIDNRSHTFLNRSILHGKTLNAAKASAGLLSCAIDQVVVIFVGQWAIAAGLIFDVDPFAGSNCR